MSDKETIENEMQADAGNPAPEVEEFSEQQLAALKDQAAKAAQYYEQLLRTTADLLGLGSALVPDQPSMRSAFHL